MPMRRSAGAGKKDTFSNAFFDQKEKRSRRTERVVGKGKVQSRRRYPVVRAGTSVRVPSGAPKTDYPKGPLRPCPGRTG